MSAYALKQAFHNDVNTLKRLDLGIIPAKLYYSKLLLGLLLVYSLFAGIQAISCYLATHTGAWGYVSEWERDRNDFDKSFAVSFGSLFETPEAKQQRYQRVEQRYKETRAKQHAARVFKMAIGVLFSSLFFTLIFMGKIKNHIIFKQQLCPHLQTGTYLVKKIRQALISFFVIFSCFSMILFPLFEQDMTFFAGITTFIFSTIAISIAITMEASRVGLCILSAAISGYFTHTPSKVAP